MYAIGCSFMVFSILWWMIDTVNQSINQLINWSINQSINQCRFFIVA